MKGEDKDITSTFTMVDINRIDSLCHRVSLEVEKNHWSSRELERQIGNLLFDRLAKSKDKEGLMKLVHHGFFQIRDLNSSNISINSII